MSTRLTASLIVCAASGLFTAGALIVNPEPARTPAAPVASPSGTPTLVIQDFAFGAITVSPGAVVSVSNLDGETHTVTADDGSFDQSVDGGGTASFAAPTTAGTYSYVCDIHPSMHGQLVVG
jgi:plastocyanin